MPAKKRPDINFALQRIFRKQSFRSVQRAVIEAALDGEDIYLQAATGLGKSLCFQLPAVVADHGITIVVSPLLSIMANQVNALRAAGVDAATLNSSISSEERSRIYRDLECGHPVTRLLYVTPELCTATGFRQKLALVHRQKELNRIVIDEAHCISEWGHEFRPSFKKLSFFRTEYPTIPITAVTATATERVRDDIVSILHLHLPTLKMFLLSTSRSNLHYEIRYVNDTVDVMKDFVGWLRSVYKRREGRIPAGERASSVSGIIYCSTRQACEDIAKALRNHGIGARPYHAGLEHQEKEDTSTSWLRDEQGYDVIVATTAFGMGIDKPNVRFVVHWQVPKSFEGYYQEAGRAGRDGNAARCFMYYSRESAARTQYIVNRDASKNNPPTAESMGRVKSFQALVAYCENTETCRHRAIAKYFGDTEVPSCDYACDICKESMAVKKAKRLGLADQEWVSSQSESYAGYGGGEFD